MGAISGKVQFGGHHASKNFLRRYTGYVEQFGARPFECVRHWPLATVRLPCARTILVALLLVLKESAAPADALIENLTVFEMLLYTAEMKIDRRMPFREKCRKVQEVIDQLALNTCRDTRIGSQVARGISGA